VARNYNNTEAVQVVKSAEVSRGRVHICQILSSSQDDHDAAEAVQYAVDHDVTILGQIPVWIKALVTLSIIAAVYFLTNSII
jgi:hypothetical protein